MADGGVILSVILIRYISEMVHVSVWVDFFYDAVFVLLPFWGEMTAATTAVTACSKTLKISIIGNI